MTKRHGRTLALGLRGLAVLTVLAAPFHEALSERTESELRGDPSPDGPNVEENNRIARLTLRHILCNPAITAPIPGMISVEQVDNAALAVMRNYEGFLRGGGGKKGVK